MTVLQGEQSDYYSYEPNSSKTSSHYSEFLISEEEIKLDMVSSTTKYTTFERNIPLQPVYVETINGVEQLVYNSRIMEPNKPYRVTWENEEFIIIKNKDSVDFYKFFPEQ